MEDSSMVAHLKLIEPRNENRSVPVRPANAELRTREYLTAKEVEKFFVFATERGGPFTTDAVNRLTKRIGERAGLGLPGFIATCCDTPAATS
jgi:hypothetical protein